MVTETAYKFDGTTENPDTQEVNRIQSLVVSSVAWHSVGGKAPGSL